MAYSFKKKENIGSSRTEYSRYYANFRGVDFSSDHTQVHESRLAYLVNMYKDYQSGQGEALETIAGFRRRAKFDGNQINGIFHFKCKVTENDKEVEKERVLVHSGTKLYLWHNYPNSIGIELTRSLVVPASSATYATELGTLQEFSISCNFPISKLVHLYDSTNTAIPGATYNSTNKVITFSSSTVKEGDTLALTYKEGVPQTALRSDMKNAKSKSFVFNNRLYILDGQNYLVYNGSTISDVTSNAYVPTTYINIIPAGENADIGLEYEQRNILTPKFKHTFIGDGTTKEFYLNEQGLSSVDQVKVYGVVKTSTTDYTVDLTAGKITFNEAPAAPTEKEIIALSVNGETVKYERGYAGIEVTASKTWTSIDGITNNMTNIDELIKNCTLCTTFDGRVFVTGNPEYPNYVFYCNRNSTGYADPTYFGVLNYMQDGVGLAPIKGIMNVSDTLMVLKADTQQDSAVYFHYGTDTGNHILPRIYPSQQGLSGLGCLGACRNFLDDPVFISRLGLEGVSQLKVASERSNEHRSSLVDAKLVNTNLKEASIEEWGGYLCILVDGQIFLADSRQRYQDKIGAIQYEWYYLDGIGVYDNQYMEYAYANDLPIELVGAVVTDNGIPLEIADKVYNSALNEYNNLCGTTANANSTDTIDKEVVSITINDVSIPMQVVYKTYNDGNKTHAYLCETKGNYIGGDFKKATTLSTMQDKGKENLFFGCVNGVICSFNFDKRDEFGNIPADSYHFDNRTIYNGCATLMDNCGIPHLTKSTIKQSTVIKTRSFQNSSAKVKVRTNKKPYEQIARISSDAFDFNRVDFTNLSFNTAEQSLFAIKEKEKQWVEKQYFVYSDEYLRPFSLYYISYRYNVAGRYKN